MRQTFLDARERLWSDIAEIALASRSIQEYRESTLGVLAPRTGVVHAAAINRSVSDGFTVSEWPGPTGLRDRCDRCMSDYRPEELQQAFATAAFRDDDMFPSRRRQEMFLYSEYLPSISVKGFAGSMWSNGNLFTAYVFGQGGPTLLSRFYRNTVDLVAELLPVLKIGERLHGAPAIDPRSAAEPCQSGFRLTSCERELLSLVERGLTNREIASIRGISPNTVRNRLVTAYQKLGVSGRAEAVFKMHAHREAAKARS